MTSSVCTSQTMHRHKVSQCVCFSDVYRHRNICARSSWHRLSVDSFKVCTLYSRPNKKHTYFSWHIGSSLLTIQSSVLHWLSSSSHWPLPSRPSTTAFVVGIHIQCWNPLLPPCHRWLPPPPMFSSLSPPNFPFKQKKGRTQCRTILHVTDQPRIDTTLSSTPPPPTTVRYLFRHTFSL